MEDRAVRGIQTVIRYIESRLGGRLELETVAEAVHYSKYHLHRMFTETVGMTLHDYVQRRRLTEAAKLLAFSRRPISQIALQCGYESQQSFSQAFKSMYKAPPAAYRAAGNFYPPAALYPPYGEGQGSVQKGGDPAGRRERYPCLDGADASGDRRLSRHGRGGVSGAAAGEHSRRTRPGPGGG